MGFQDARKKCIFYSGYICSATKILKYSAFELFMEEKTNQGM